MQSASSNDLVPDGLPKRLEESWQRCQELGLPRDAAASIEPVGSTEVRTLLQRDEQLLSVARAELQALNPALEGTGHLAFVVDDLGFVVAVAGNAQSAGPILGRIRQGVNLSEAVCGTNAAGTVLVERQATFVRRSQHYLCELSVLDCFAMPVMGSSGQLLGALTVSSAATPQVAGVAELIQLAVSRMERALLRNLASPLLMHLHPHIDGLGSAAEGLVAMDANGEVIGLNSAAARMFGVAAAGLKGRSLETVFENDPLRMMPSGQNSATVLRVRGGLGLSAVLTRNFAPSIDTAIRVKPSAGKNGVHCDLRLIEALSKRELQVLNHLKLGLSNQEIARCLFISEDSIKFHLKNVFSKLRTKTRLEAVKVAQELGLFDENGVAAPKMPRTS